MPNFHLATFAAELQRMQPDCLAVQIGAMDGKSNDPLYPLLQKYRWRALLVEPLADQFALLKANYAHLPHVVLENCAVTEVSGEQTIYRLPRRLVEEEQWPAWALGASSFFQDRNALMWESVKPHVVEERVHCLTFAELLHKHQITKIDLLQIDAEGYDFKILKQLPWEKMQPEIINLEIVNLPKAESALAKQLLDKHHYFYQKSGYNLLAVSAKLLNFATLPRTLSQKSAAAR